MSKRSILNITSIKKRNGMLTFSNTTSTGSLQTPAVSPAYIPGNATARFLWQATAMDLTDSAGAGNRFIDTAARTSTTCFMKGLSEHVKIQTSSGIPWFHRRICFKFRGRGLAQNAAETSPLYAETSAGMQRLFNNIGVDSAPITLAAREAIIFKGQIQQDWNDPIIAPVDTARVDLMFDKTWTLKSGNQSGTVYERKLYHPMNKNIVYNDDEQGNNKITNFDSVTSKQGMGDYYVYDIISPGLGGTSTDIAAIYSNSTLYWHEK